MPAAHTPRWSCREPTRADVETFLAAQSDAGNAPAFSYAEVGATRSNTSHPAGYTLDWNRICVGTGERDFTAAVRALRQWRMFPTPWTRILPVDAPIVVGQTLAMQAHALGMWWMNACRIVYVLDENAGPNIARQFGFAYGTLPAHVEQGEERFSVELHVDDSVWYDLRAFSRPRFWPVRLAKPLARRLQRRFVRESQAAMAAAVGNTAILQP